MNGLSCEVTIGADEVGRGCLWGPEVVAAVATINLARVTGVRDSKAVKVESVRFQLAERIKEAHPHEITLASADTIDRFGIEESQRACTYKAVVDLLQRLRTDFGHFGPIQICLDGSEPSVPAIADIPDEIAGETYFTQYKPKADSTIYEVSAASLVAKSYRDRWCDRFVAANPNYAGYGLETNYGYGTAAHEAAIRSKGLTPQHRQTFCRKFLHPSEAPNASIHSPTAAG